MPSPNAILAAVVVAAALPVLPVAAQQAQPCTGTLCDLYYNHTAAEPAQQPAPAKATTGQTAAGQQVPAGATPLTVPSGGVLGFFNINRNSETAPSDASGTPQSRPLVGVGGGGLAAMARGEKADRCTGTICDLFYGGPPAEKAAAAPAAAGQAALARDAADAPAGARFEEDERAEARRQAPARCASKNADPWSCYR
jgi:hypothetical protein